MKTTQMKSPQGDRAHKDEGVKKLPFVEPKLAFVTPKLVKQGEVKKITAGFFGSFYP